jgi:membrane protein implicated in regulation of membrane protease activity
MILGAVLLGAELLGVDAAFYLVFVGFAAILTGMLDLGDAGMPLWGEWILFAGLALFLMVGFRERVYRKFRGVATDYPHGPEGRMLRITEGLDPGATGRMEYRGTTWTVVNGGEEALLVGDEAQVLRVEGTTLIVTAGEHSGSTID